MHDENTPDGANAAGRVPPPPPSSGSTPTTAPPTQEPGFTKGSVPAPPPIQDAGYPGPSPSSFSPSVTPQEPPSRGEGWTIGKTLLLIFVLLCVLAVLVIFFVFRFLGSVGDTVSDNVPRSAEIGQCFDNSQSQLPVSCDEPHHYEVMSRITLPDGPYPSRIERLAGTEVCEASFEEYTGHDYDDSILVASAPFPPEDQWSSGVRGSVCVVHEIFFEELANGSLRAN